MCTNAKSRSCLGTSSADFFHQNDGEGQPSGLCEAKKRRGGARCVHGIILVAHFLLVRCNGTTNEWRKVPRHTQACFLCPTLNFSIFFSFVNFGFRWSRHHTTAGSAAYIPAANCSTH
ncbi:unnamed protein product [Ectocarpus sp. 8 AP-2014]